MTRTDQARQLLSKGLYSIPEIARRTQLHESYVRKILQRDSGRDKAWNRWRANNPDVVRKYRQEQDENRRRQRAQARGASDTPSTGKRVQRQLGLASRLPSA